MPIPRLRDYSGPALFSYGFRPFFFFGAVYTGAIILVWLPAFYGQLSLATAFTPRDWHVHEMLFGYVSAVVAGFLLTAVPNWTGRLPLQGRPLAILFSVWVIGRIAVSSSAWLGWAPAMIIDAAFLVLLAAAAAREIIAGKKWGIQCRPHHQPVRRRQSGVSSGSALFRIRRLCHPRRHRAGDHPDHADRRQDHSELHAQLACQAQAGANAGAVRTLRHRHRRVKRHRACAVGRPAV